MGDLKTGEGFLDAIMIRKDIDGTAATGLVPICIVMKLSDGSTVLPTVVELSIGVYKATDWTPADDTEYMTIWTVVGAYTIYAAYKLFKVGGGVIADWEEGGRLDLIIDALALEATLGVVDGLVNDIIDDIGVFPTANYATLAAYVEDIRTRHIALVTALGAEFDGTPSVYTAMVTGMDTSAIPGDIDGAIIEILKAIAGATWTAETQEAIYALLDSILDMTETGDTLPATGGVDVFYINNAPSGIFEPRHLLVDFTNMAGADEVTIRIKYRITPGGALLLNYEEDFGPGAVSPPCWDRELIPNRYGYSVELEQTAGVNRDFPWSVFYSG